MIESWLRKAEDLENFFHVLRLEDKILGRGTRSALSSRKLLYLSRVSSALSKVKEIAFTGAGKRRATRKRHTDKRRQRDTRVDTTVYCHRRRRRATYTPDKFITRIVHNLIVHRFHYVLSGVSESFSRIPLSHFFKRSNYSNCM
uniref:Uncharacterized protein n=1 Tax=Trichogramma kaykai TaxID=54128 RepID=A0ABD2WAS7_9HYME